MTTTRRTMGEIMEVTDTHQDEYTESLPRCGVVHNITGAVCKLDQGHKQNHYGETANMCVQWPSWDNIIPSRPETPSEALERAGITPRALGQDELRRVGAMMIGEEGQVENSKITDFVEQQKESYKGYSREHLIEELCRRDRNAIIEGQNLADGRTAGRLLREFVRGMLYAADHAQLRTIRDEVQDTTKAGLVENILRKLGAEPAPARMLRMYGTPLGTGATAEEAEQNISSPERIPQLPSTSAADSIRDFRAKNVAQPASPANQETSDHATTDTPREEIQDK